MHRSLARVVAALVLSVAGTAAAASAASAGTIAVDPVSGLGDSQALTVTGSGYSTATYPVGVYAGQIAIVDGTVHTSMASADYVTAARISEGAFTATVNATRTFASGPTTIDCGEVQCAVGVWRAHTVPTVATLDGTADVSFAQVPTLTVTPSTGLDPEGDSVAVAATGFRDVADPTHGLYVVQAAIVDGVLRYGNARQVSPTPTTATMWQLDTDGAFSGTLPVTRTFTQGGVTVDCAVTQCQVVTFKARTAPTEATLFTRSDIAFASGGSGGGGGTGGGGSFGLAVSPTSGLSAAGPTTVSVVGTGYSPSEPGIYLVYGPLAGRTDAGQYSSATKWLHVGGGTLSATGSFATTMPVEPVFTNANGNVVNCTQVQCYVQTMRAHGMTDIDQDFAVPVSFASTVSTSEAIASAAQAPADGTPSQAPIAPATSAGSAAAVVAPNLGQVRVGRGGRASLTVSERSTVTFVLRKKVKGTWKVVKVVRVKAPGQGTVGAKLPIGAAGHYRLSIKAVSSETGKASKKVVKHLTVKAKKAKRR